MVSYRQSQLFSILLIFIIMDLMLLCRMFKVHLMLFVEVFSVTHPAFLFREGVIIKTSRDMTHGEYKFEIFCNFLFIFQFIFVEK